MVISTKFSDFVTSLAVGRSKRENQTFTDIDPSRLVAIVSFFVSTFDFWLSFHLNDYCLCHQSVLVSFSFVIIKGYWMSKKKRERPTVRGFSPHCIDIAVANKISTREKMMTKMQSLEWKMARKNSLNWIEGFKANRKTHKIRNPCKRLKFVRNNGNKHKMNICYHSKYH